MPTIQQLVAEGRIKEALELLPAGDDQTIMLKGRFSKNEKEKTSGFSPTRSTKGNTTGLCLPF
ncbi:MAG: hypothetical protein IPN20_23445 [Haliscomenobacter sp.]|nr:hypothetical protein [Haliscomenobacter sp.]